jgi:aspartyl-tRNA(Asn)/glutamyl-tRNA(Gln) amidotransferase subunit A
MTIAELAPQIQSGKISPVELVQQSLQRITALQPNLNAFVTVTGEWALKQAQLEEQEIRAGRYQSRLHGIPFAAKDLLYTKGIRTTVGSKIFIDFVPTFDAAVIERLYQAGAILVGKAGLHEWAYGITSNNPHFGAIRNPWNPDCIPGGSSGGSAVAVSAEMCPYSLGSDTGGSIRIPAAFCSVVGLKATFGRVSRHGVFPLGFSLDHIGPFALTVEDAASVYQTIAGADSRDDSIVDRPIEAAVLTPNPRLDGKKIGVPRNFYYEKLHSDVEAATRKALTVFEQLGASLVDIEVPNMDEYNAVARLILLAEASSVHARRLQERREDFGEDVRALFDQGRFILATDYLNAQRQRRTLAEKFRDLLTKVDAIVTPAVALPPPKIGQNTVQLAGEEMDVRAAVTRISRALNLTGLPLLTLP